MWRFWLRRRGCTAGFVLLTRSAKRRGGLFVAEPTPTERVIYEAEHSTHFRLPWQSDHLRALRPTIAVADGSVGVRELTHEWSRRFGSLFATGYGNYFQISSRQPEDRRHAQFVDQERKDV